MRKPGFVPVGPPERDAGTSRCAEGNPVQKWSMRAATRIAIGVAAVLTLLALAAGQPVGQKPSPVEPLPQDTGAAGLKQMLRRLNTTARLMQVVAHPDDEDGGMLTLESRGKGASVTLLTLNRGEGGQNKVGSNLFDVLGVLRTLELTASDRYYGVHQRFTRVADFGFSKSPEETFQKWQGHDIALADIVRVIRTFRPDVLVARFSGTDRDGHGHHQASSILTREAFRAAADPNRFPEQIQEGLLPWQAKKLYVGNVCGFFAPSCADENYTLKLNTGKPDPQLGMSYIQFAMEGLRHQLSQGAGGWSVEPGDRFTYYKLVDSVMPASQQKDHEKDFFDGIDTSLVGLSARLGGEEAKIPAAKSALQKTQDEINKAEAAHDANSAAGPLLSALLAVRRLAREVKASAVSAPAKEDLLLELQTKEEQLQQAVNLALEIQFQVTADAPIGKDPEDAFVAVPGQSFRLIAELTATWRIEKPEVGLEMPAGWKSKLVEHSPGSRSRWIFEVAVPADAQYSRPYWHRADPERDAVNTIDDPAFATLPFPPPILKAHVAYAVEGKEGLGRTVAMVKYKAQDGSIAERALAVAPAFSVALEPGGQVIPEDIRNPSVVKVAVQCNVPGTRGTLHLQVPDDWHVEPAQLPEECHARSETQEFQFKVAPTSLQQGSAEIRAVLDSNGRRYSEGYSVVTREDLDTFYYYQPAVQRVSVVEVKVPTNLKVGYIMGAGDDIPTVLRQLGIDVTLIPAEKLASEDLSQYKTIVLGIRAYDTQKDLATNNKKLLDYVSNGGTLVVQYNTGVGDFNSGHFTPYPAQLSRARVSVEEAPVEILAPDDAIFHSPNQISGRDFDGWVQERGLYFMDSWDERFTPLLSCHDPGEAPQKGGLLKAQYGKGTYIYAAYAFFRQLPAGVPGAIRLYVNLLAGR